MNIGERSFTSVLSCPAVDYVLTLIDAVEDGVNAVDAPSRSPMNVWIDTEMTVAHHNAASTSYSPAPLVFGC